MSKGDIKEDIAAEFDAAGIPVADWDDYARKVVHWAANWLSAIREPELQAAAPEDVAKLIEHARRVANLRQN
jgi:hypothetical protein